MWPSGFEQHAQANMQPMSMPMYSASPYAPAPQDLYPHAAAAAAAAAGFDAWAVQQAPGAYGSGLPRGLGHPHMVQAHLAGGHGMAHPMLGTPQHIMAGGQHPGAAGVAASVGGMMMGWPPGHAMPPPPANGLAGGGRMPGGADGRGWHGGRGGGYGGAPGSRQGGQFGGRGGRGRRNVVLNTKPGDFSDAAVEEFAWSVRRTPAGEPLDLKLLADGLQNLDSRGLAALLKELARGHHGRRAREVFDFIRGLPGDHALSPLCDVFTYTAMVSLCVDQQELSRAFELVAEMKQRNVERNVHTYTALMNVAIKCGQLQRALEVYSELLREGCVPNVVTFNTLIDVYGKTGQWSEALRVVDQMTANNLKPVTRTYNTLMIACNTSGQWQEALNVYAEMVRMGHQPNTTTYNALISAHSKAGRLEKVMEVYQEMLRTGCERSVITYSALISACEKAGQWQLALNLFSEMLKERCTPNVITYNSLITACAQGAQWAKAAEVFQQMQASGCKPDVVTYTALVSAYERGGQWVKALEAFQQMQQQGCSADAILYNTLLDVLWDTGVPWAQHKAAQLFRQAMDGGHFRALPQPPALAAVPAAPAAPVAAADKAGSSAPSSPSAASAASGSPTAQAAAGGGAAASVAGSSAAAAPSKLELGLQGVSAGVAMLMLHCWFADLRDFVVQHTQQQEQEQLDQQQQPLDCLPDRVVLSTGRSRQRDHVSGILRDSTFALLGSWGSPLATEGGGGGGSSKLEAPGTAVAEWLLGEGMGRMLASFARRLPPPAAATAAELAAESALDKRCRDAFSEVKMFENTHNLSVQSMGYSYPAARAGLVARLLEAAAGLAVRDDVAHDAVLLMDRCMSASLKISEDAYTCMAASCLHLVVGGSALPGRLPSLGDICEALGVSSVQEAEAMVGQIGSLLKGDTASISALRCLKLYLERLGCVFEDDGDAGAGAGGSRELVTSALELAARAALDGEFLNYRPTVTAAAVLYCQRLSRGLLPFWPSSLAGLTGYSNARTPELAAAINGAQRLGKQMAAGRKGSGAAAAPAPAAPDEPAGTATPAADAEVSVADACGDDLSGELAKVSLADAVPAGAGSE